MDFNKTVDLIIRDLEEAREIIDDLKNYPGVPAIQIEMAKSKCRNAAEVIALFKNQQTPTQAEPKKEPAVSKPVSIDPPAKKNPESPDPATTGQDLAESTHKPETISRKPVTGIIADSFDHLPGSLNKKLGSMRDDDNVPDYLKTKPIANLSQAIGINDRFLFIRELFDGNSDSYHRTISGIDEAKTLAEAKVLILDCTGDKSESEACKQLLDLVKRKFPGDE
jgi:hypothetical protein